MAEGHSEGIVSLLRGASRCFLWVAITGAESRTRREMHSCCDEILSPAWHWAWSARLALADGIRKRNVLVLLLIRTSKHKSCLRIFRRYI